MVYCALLTLLFGAFFFSAKRERASADGLCFPAGVEVDGVSVGGLKREKGLALLYEKTKEKTPVFLLSTPQREYDFTDEISFSADFERLFSLARKNGKYQSKIEWILLGKEEKIKRILDENNKKPLDATVQFNRDGFTYYPSQIGYQIKEDKLRFDVENALRSPYRKEGVWYFPKVEAIGEKVSPKTFEKELYSRTKKLSSFTTYYSVEDRGRCENIALASRFLDGLTIGAGEEFSFNEAVGERTKKRGFQNAKIIQDGRLIEGNGGGVCQVSTTLYNASLLCGMEVKKRQPHSLRVGYVPPSLDAMVSSFSDFRFVNPYPFPVYLSAKTGEGYVNISFYGKPTEFSYKITSRVLEKIPPPKELIVYGEKEGILQKESVGIKSEAFLEVYKGGRLLSRKRLSCDHYAPIQGIIGKKRENTGEKMLSNACVF